MNKKNFLNLLIFQDTESFTPYFLFFMLLVTKMFQEQN